MDWKPPWDADPADGERIGVNLRALEWLEKQCPDLDSATIVDACTPYLKFIRFIEVTPEKFVPYDATPLRERVAAELLRLLYENPGGASGQTGHNAYLQYLTALLIQATASCKDPITPSLELLLCRLLIGTNSRLVDEVVDGADESAALDAALDKFSADERVTVRVGAQRLGVPERTMRRWLESDSFNNKLVKRRSFRIFQQKYFRPLFPKKKTSD
jgi:hypothetical protein